MDQYRSLDDILAELEQQREQKPQLYIPVPTKAERKLMLMGSTRAGKSTIVETLENSLYQPERPTFYSATRTPQIRQISGLKIIDMPGFNDLQVRNSTLSNDSILQMLQEQMNEHHPVDLFAFVFNFHGGIKHEDIKTVIYVKSRLPDLTGRTILVITHAEELDDKMKQRLMDEFFSHRLVMENHLKDFFQKDIFFLGCLRYESLNHRDERALTNEHQNVLGMRKKFIQKCFGNLPSPKRLEQKQPNYTYLLILALILASILLGVFISSYGTRDNARDLTDPIDHSSNELNAGFSAPAGGEEKSIPQDNNSDEGSTDSEKPLQIGAQSETSQTSIEAMDRMSMKIEKLTQVLEAHVRRSNVLEDYVIEERKRRENSWRLKWPSW